ncbi:MAG: hypothetical protein RL385_2592 [Pseudomonadota bacterium]|jgi:hypothetical protein
MKRLAPALLVLAIASVSACYGDSSSAPEPLAADAGQTSASGSSGRSASEGTDLEAAGAADGGLSDITAMDSASLERDSIAKLDTCGLYEPTADPKDYVVEDAFDVCLARCVLDAPCDEVLATFCEDRSNAYARCISGCPLAPPDGFRCAGGGTIPRSYQCDNTTDCTDGSDERGCQPYTCADGEKLTVTAARCDLVEDCEDGSDETGCKDPCS